MQYLSAAKITEKWNISERSVRNYCAHNRVEGAFITGKTWTYHSNRMDGSRLTHDQARYIFETNTIGVEKEALNVDDVIETANHFRCIDRMIDHAKAALTEKLIKELHLILKMESAIPEKIGLRLAIIKRCRMKSAVWRLHFRKKLPIR